MFKQHPLLENITTLCSLQSCQSSKLHHHLPSWEHQAPNQSPAERTEKDGGQAAPETGSRDIAETLPMLTQGTNLAGFAKATTVGVCSPGESMPLNRDPVQLMTGSSCCQKVTRQAGAETTESSWPQPAHTHPDPCPGTSSKPDFPRRWQRQSKR